MTGTRVAALLIAVAFALAGCKGADRGPGIATAGGAASAQATVTPAADQEQRARQFAQCMRDQGIDVPDPDTETGVKGVIVGAQEPDKQKVTAALEKCRQFLPDGGQPSRLSPEAQEALRQHAQCMRENGVPDWPDPDADGGVKVPGNAGPDLDKNSPVLRAALEKCRDKLPQPGEGGK